jgi:hypothetical protein
MPSRATCQESASDPIAPPNVFAGASIFQFVFSFASMLGMCLIARVFFKLRAFEVDPDIWWHIKYGESILATHHWPVTETYSFTVAGQHWLAYEWLGDVLLAAVYHVAGLRGLGALLIVLGCLFAIALYYYTTMRCGNPKVGFLASAVLLNLANTFNLRPQMLSYIYLIFALIILERFRQGKRGTVWLLPLLMLMWINTHGLWIIGLGTIGVFLACGLVSIRFGNLETNRWTAAECRQLTLVFLMCALATLITPYGTGLAKFPFIVSSLPSGIANIQEWQPMTFYLPDDKLFLALPLGFLLVQVLVHPKWRLEELGLFLFGTLLAFTHLRFLLLFVAFFAPFIVAILARWMPRYDRAKEVYALNAVVILGILGSLVWYFPSRSDYARVVESNFPVQAVRYLDTHSVPGPMYNSYEFGGYLLWARGPQHKVFIDGRAEVYERTGVFQDQDAFANLQPGSLALLDKYGIQSCLLLHDEPLAVVLQALPDWEKIYSDGTSVLFARRKNDSAQRASEVEPNVGRSQTGRPFQKGRLGASPT